VNAFRVGAPELRRVGIVFNDITDRKRREEELHELAERFRFLAESMPQKIFTATPKGDVDYFNRQWMDFTGLTFAQIRDWGWVQFIHPDDVEENIRSWKYSIESGKSRNEAFGEWGARLLRRFKIPKREALLSTDMPAVEAWYRQQKAIQKRGYKTKAPDQWRSSRIKAIKAAMNGMEKTNESYYPELSDRLNLKRAFTSLTGLTKTDLDRVYQMVLRDSRR
jgi:PAS domain-containing protein